MVAFKNTTNRDVVIKPYERVAQGVFVKYYITDDDNTTEERTGGVGSTGRK